MPSPLHPLTTDIAPPERFTYPFCYEPHPLCLLAAEEVKQEIERIQPSEGKMFGVLVVEGATVNCKPSTVNCKPSTVNCKPSTVNYSFLAAYSGLLEGRNDWPYFVPPVYDAQDPNGYFKTREREISDHVRGYGGTGVRGCENTPEADKKDSTGVDGNLAPPHPRTPVPPNFSPPVPPNSTPPIYGCKVTTQNQLKKMRLPGNCILFTLFNKSRIKLLPKVTDTSPPAPAGSSQAR